MPVVAVVPVRSFHQGKERLAEVIPPELRAGLGRALADRTISAVESAGLIPVVVAGDEDVAAWASMLGIPALPDPKQGLSPAIELGVEWAETSGMPWLALHADLPLIRATELTPLAAALEKGREVIAPSSDGGTTALGAARRVRLSYGPGSFVQHLPHLADPVIVTSLGLLHDLDTPVDLQSAMSHPRGRWMRDLALGGRELSEYKTSGST